MDIDDIIIGGRIAVGGAILISFVDGLYQGINTKNGTPSHGLESTISFISAPLNIGVGLTNGLIKGSIKDAFNDTHPKGKIFETIKGAAGGYALHYIAKSVGFMTGYMHG